MGKRELHGNAASKDNEEIENDPSPNFEAEDLDVSSSDSEDELAADGEGGESESEESAAGVDDEEDDTDVAGSEGLESSDDEIDRAVLDLVQGKNDDESQPPEHQPDRQDRTADAGSSQQAADETDSSDDERPNRNTGEYIPGTPPNRYAGSGHT